MPKFSKYFGLNKSQAQLDFVDINTDEDLHLFIDPYVFSTRTDAWSAECHEAILSFFQAVLDAIKKKDDQRGRRLLDNLHEPNETCLGLSKGHPEGRGVGEIQADDLYYRLSKSKAARSGLLEELSDCELFIERFGPDKVSDVTTNIIRTQLISYTHTQCDLIGIDLDGGVASGPLWNPARERWEHKYVTLPVINGKKVLLVPKASVRWNLAFSHTRYYNQFVLEFLQAEHLNQGSALVEALKNGRRRVTKKSLKEVHPLSKAFLAEFTDEHPDVLRRYKGLLGIPAELSDKELSEGFDERPFAKAMSQTLGKIPRGTADASHFHSFAIGMMEFIFYPDLIYPSKEQEINQGRKRIDIVYTNNGNTGFFFRRRLEPQTRASWLFVECKNYSREIANPELDQLAGRFSPARGRLGFLVGRNFDDRARFVERCRDTARQDQGFIIPLVDDDVHEMLELIALGKRADIDNILERKWREITA